MIGVLDEGQEKVYYRLPVLWRSSWVRPVPEVIGWLAGM